MIIQHKALMSLKQKATALLLPCRIKMTANLRTLTCQREKPPSFLALNLRASPPTAIGLADEFIQVPMVGFTESLNISVSAAICIHYLTAGLRKSSLPWQLNRR